MTWIDCLMNPEALATLYAARPGLERLDVLELTLDREGPTLRLRADLARFPDRPSRRWAPGANTAQVTLDFFGVLDFEVQGFGVANSGVLTVDHTAEGRLHFAFMGASTRFAGRCASLRLAAISAYVADVASSRP